MFKIRVRTEAGSTVENFTVTRKTAEEVQEYRQELRAAAPLGSSVTRFEVKQTR